MLIISWICTLFEWVLPRPILRPTTTFRGNLSCSVCVITTKQTNKQTDGGEHTSSSVESKYFCIELRIHLKSRSWEGSLKSFGKTLGNVELFPGFFSKIAGYIFIYSENPTCFSSVSTMSVIHERLQLSLSPAEPHTAQRGSACCGGVTWSPDITEHVKTGQ